MVIQSGIESTWTRRLRTQGGASDCGIIIQARNLAGFRTLQGGEQGGAAASDCNPESAYRHGV